MGEAKRIAAARREQAAVGVSITTRDVTGAEFQARVAGSPAEFIAAARRMAAEEAEGGRPIAAVPCNGCSACCYTQRRIDVDPAQEPAESLAHLGLVVDELGARLPQNPDGSCAHVTPHGCGVYEYRPAACRRYDCRFFSLAAISVPPAPGGQTEPRWLFSPETPEDFALLTLAEVGAARFAAEQAGADWTAEDALKAALQYALPRLPEQTARTAALRALPAAKRQALAQSLARTLQMVEQRGRQ